MLLIHCRRSFMPSAIRLLIDCHRRMRFTRSLACEWAHSGSVLLSVCRSHLTLFRPQQTHSFQVFLLSPLQQLTLIYRLFFDSLANSQLTLEYH